jgi:hypothetical protein
MVQLLVTVRMDIFVKAVLHYLIQIVGFSFRLAILGNNYWEDRAHQDITVLRERVIHSHAQMPPPEWVLEVLVRTIVDHAQRDICAQMVILCLFLVPSVNTAHMVRPHSHVQLAPTVTKPRVTCLLIVSHAQQVHGVGKWALPFQNGISVHQVCIVWNVPLDLYRALKELFGWRRAVTASTHASPAPRGITAQRGLMSPSIVKKVHSVSLVQLIRRSVLVASFARHRLANQLSAHSAITAHKDLVVRTHVR